MSGWRAKSASGQKCIIAFGDCAVTGNVTAIRNQLGLGNDENVLQRAYVELSETNPQIPGDSGVVPVLLKRVMPVQEVVYVDYYLPGCPPPAARIKLLLEQMLAGKEPKLAGLDIKFG